MTRSILISIDGPVATITLNQPAKKNALSAEMWQAIPETFTKVCADKAVRCIILTGAGDSFAAGADISEFEQVYASTESARVYSEGIRAAMTAVAECPLPVIARIDGACVGGGCGLALACDLRLASEHSKFGITPGKLGLAYTLEDTKRLVNAVGLSMARYILFTGDILRAPQALEIGLIDFIEEDLDKAITSLASKITENSAFSIQTAKSFIRRISDGQAQDDEATTSLFLSAFEGEDFREGYRAFMEKRKPDFSS